MRKRSRGNERKMPTAASEQSSLSQSNCKAVDEDSTEETRAELTSSVAVDAGDLLKLRLEVDANGIITHAKLEASGSVSAYSLIATEWLIGRSIEDCMNIEIENIKDHLKTTPMYFDASFLVKEAIECAVSDYKQNIELADLHTATEQAKHLSFLVSGVSYVVPESVLTSYPNSLLSRMLLDERGVESSEPLVIHRNAELFRHVIDFMMYQCLPRNKQLKCLLDNDTLLALLEEAEYYQLPDLAHDINELLHVPDKTIFAFYKAVRNMLVNGVCSYLRGVHLHAVFKSRVVNALQPFYVPSCVRGRLYPYDTPIYKSSTVRKLNIDELLADATPSHFGRNTETVFDRSVRDSLEIKAEHLNAKTLEEIAKQIDLSMLSKNMCLEARPYKLVIYPEGGHFAPHRDTIRGDNHVGTVVYVLDSNFTGGEFLVHSGGETMMMKEPREWVAMFGDCMHEIRPVLSGVRVTLVYDIYCTGTKEQPSNKECDVKEEDYQYDENAKCSDDYWDFIEHTMIGGGSGINEGHKQRLITACQQVGSPFCITLQHLYPKSQSTMHFLKGGDRVLFDTLRERFEVQLVPILYCHFNGGDEQNKNYIIPDSVKPLRLKYDLGRDDLFPLFVPATKLCENHLIYRQQYAEFTGNEPQEGHNAFLLRGLFVIPKV